MSEEPEVVCLQEWVLLCLEELMVVCLELDVILNDLDLMTTFGDPEVMSALQDCTVFHSNSPLSPRSSFMV